MAAVALGGALGAFLRWAGHEVAPHEDGFPWTTLLINVCGAFLLALLPAIAAVRRHPVLPLFLGPGVLGGFTTLSTFSEETRALVAAGAAGMAAAYVLATLAASTCAVVIARNFSTAAARDEFADEEGHE